MPRPLVVFLLFLLALPAVADDAYTRVLVPVLPLPGWGTELWMRNDGAQPAGIYPLTMDRIGHPVNCTPSSRCFDIPLTSVPAKTTLMRTSLGLESRTYRIPVEPQWAGAILHVTDAEALKTRLTVLGTQVPIVREDAFQSAPASLRIQTLESARYALRIYSLDAEDVDVTVRFFMEVGNGSETLTSEIPLRLTRPDGFTHCGTPPCPWPDDEFLPSFAAHFFDAGQVLPWVYRVEIDAPDGVKLWAMISETDNETRAVRIFALD